MDPRGEVLGVQDDDSENRLVRVGFAGNEINILSFLEWNTDGDWSLRVASIHTIHTKTAGPPALEAVPNCSSHPRSLGARYSEESDRGCP